MRVIFFAILAAALAVWIAPSWQEAERTLALRLRTGDEIEELVRRGVRELGARAMRMATEREDADVAAGPPAREPRESLTGGDRARLDRLVQEKLNEE